MKIKRLTGDAILSAIALTIFMVELYLPTLTPIPGVKLGLANIVTVFAIFVLRPLDAGMILAARIALGAMFSGQMTAVMYSLAGGILCFLVMLVMRKIVTEKQIWVASVIGAIAHNIGQIIVAVLITQTTAIIAYLPVLAISGTVAGLFTGLCAQFLTARCKRLF